MKIKTSELIDAALDWAVALARDESVRVEGGRVRFALSQFTNDYDLYSPSTDWAQGGPIIEQAGIELRPSRFGATGWTAWTLDRATKTQPRNVGKSASSPLTAAMRCYVASKLGDEVDVPEELT